VARKKLEAIKVESDGIGDQVKQTHLVNMVWILGLAEQLLEEQGVALRIVFPELMV